MCARLVDVIGHLRHARRASTHKTVEPATDVDAAVAGSLQVMPAASDVRKLRDEGRCVLFSSHIMQEVAALCDHIIVIAKGKVVAQGSPDALRAQTGEANLEDAFVKAIGTDEGLFG